jgi:hypothetical protein
MNVPEYFPSRRKDAGGNTAVVSGTVKFQTAG